jgi:hypothetical protein
VPDLVSIWLRTRNWSKRLPFLEKELLLDCPINSIRVEYNVLPFIK